MLKSKANNFTLRCNGIRPLTEYNAKVIFTDNGQNFIIEQNGIISVYQLVYGEFGVQGKLLWEYHSKEQIISIVPLDLNHIALLCSIRRQAVITIVSQNHTNELNLIHGEPISMISAKNQLVIAVKKDKDNQASLVGIDTDTGNMAWRISLEDEDVELLYDNQTANIIVNHRKKRLIRRFNMMKCCEQEKGRDDDDSSGDCCYNGVSLIPFDCYDLLAYKNTILKRHNRRCELELDCSAYLDWHIWYVKKCGDYVVAWSKGNRGMAIVDPKNMQVIHEQYFGDSHPVAAHAYSSSNMIYFDFFAKSWNIIDLRERSSPFDSVKLASRENSSFTFIGEEIHKHSNAPTTGNVKVLVVPVIEPGQAFGDSNLENFSKYIKSNFFNEIIDYYEELSYNNMHLNLTILGMDEPTFIKNR